MGSSVSSQLLSLLREALSRREKAVELSEESARLLAAGRMERGRYDALARFYRDQLTSAETVIARVRDQAAAGLKRLERELKRTEVQQSRLREKAAAGGTPAETIRETEERLRQKRYETADEIVTFKEILAAQNAGDLGGPVEVSFGETCAAGIMSRKPTTGPDRVLLYAVPVIGVVSVFLPWLAGGGVTRSLVTVGFLFLHVGICADPLPLVVRFLWVPVALLPLLALLVGMMGTRLRIVAWGLLFLGLLMVAASLFPAALLTTRSVQPLGVAGLFGAPRTGAYAYLLAGMLCVVLGARKHDRALGEGSSSWRELVGLLGCVAAVFLVSTVALFAMPRSDGAVFTAGRSPGTEERVTVTCVNHMRRPIVLFVPWPERRSLLAETAPSAVRYGIRVYARAESTSEFQLLPAIGGVWRHKGRALPENAAVTVEPGLAADLELDVGPIQQLVGRIVGLRVHVTDNGGRIIHEFETPIAARAALQALPRGAPPVVRPGLRPVTRAVEGERAPREERPSPTQPERPAFIVRLRGIVGDRAALEVVRGQGAGSQNVMAAVGDEVAPGWSVEAVSMRPVAVTFLEQRTGERIKAERGIEVRLVLGGE